MKTIEEIGAQLFAISPRSSVANPIENFFHFVQNLAKCPFPFVFMLSLFKLLYYISFVFILSVRVYLLFIFIGTWIILDFKVPILCWFGKLFLLQFQTLDLQVKRKGKEK